MAAMEMLEVTEDNLIPKWSPAIGQAWLDSSLLWELVEIAFDSV